MVLLAHIYSFIKTIAPIFTPAFVCLRTGRRARLLFYITAEGAHALRCFGPILRCCIVVITCTIIGAGGGSHIAPVLCSARTFEIIHLKRACMLHIVLARTRCTD
jgi:hypothetical protein